MTFFILLFRNRNGKDFSEINIWNFKKSYLAGPMRGKIYDRTRFQWNCRARSTTLLNITFHWWGFPVNASEFSGFLLIGLKRASKNWRLCTAGPKTLFKHCYIRDFSLKICYLKQIVFGTNLWWSLFIADL